MDESRKIGDSIHKILDLDGVVTGGLVLKLYEDLFDEHTSYSNFLQSLYYFLGRGKSVGHLSNDYDLYIDGDMVYNYYTPQQAQLFNSVKVDILDGYRKASIKTKDDDTIPLKDYHELERTSSPTCPSSSRSIRAIRYLPCPLDSIRWATLRLSSMALRMDPWASTPSSCRLVSRSITARRSTLTTRTTTDTGVSGMRSSYSM